MKQSKFLVLAAALFFAASISTIAQPGPGGQGARPERGGRGGFGGRGFFGPRLPEEQQALVDRINNELMAENQAIAAASSNLVVASFISPKDETKINEANRALAKAREAWAAKTAKLVAEIQTSNIKLSEDALALLIQSASGRGGFGPRGFGPGGGRGFGRGGRGGFGPGGSEGTGGRGGAGRRGGDGAGQRGEPNP